MLCASASATTVLSSHTLPFRNDDSGVCMNDVSHSPVNHPTQSNVNQSSGAAHGTNKVVMTTGKEGDEKAVLESDQTYPGCFPWACGITMDNAGALKGSLIQTFTFVQIKLRLHVYVKVSVCILNPFLIN